MRVTTWYNTISQCKKGWHNMRIFVKLFTSVCIKNGKKALHEIDAISQTPFQYAWERMEQQLQHNREVAYVKDHGLAQITSYEEFRSQIPFTTYDDYASYIACMKEGKENQLTVDPVEIYAVTSGSVDNPKNIPNTKQHISTAGRVLQTLPLYAISQGLAKDGKKIKSYKMYHFCECKYQIAPSGIPIGSISGYGMARMKKVLPFLYATPSETVFQEGKNNVRYIHARSMLENRKLTSLTYPFVSVISDIFSYIEDNFEQLVYDIETGTVHSEVLLSDETRRKIEKRIKKNPKRAKELRAALPMGFGDGACKKIWPHLSYLYGVGTGPFAAKTEKVKRYTGDIPMYFSIFGSSEGLFGVCTELESKQYLMIPMTGLHEFIPLSEVEEEFPRALNMEEVQVGEEYELVISNMSGFYRYRMRDVVKVVGKRGQIPIIEFFYRLNQLLSLAGEKTNDTHMQWAIKEFEQETGLDVVDYSVEMVDDIYPQHYCVYIETNHGIFRKSIEEHGRLLQEKLAIANPSYGHKVEHGILAPLTLKILQEETYILYKEILVEKGVSATQIKPIRIIDTPMKHRFFNALLEEIE